MVEYAMFFDYYKTSRTNDSPFGQITICDAQECDKIKVINLDVTTEEFRIIYAMMKKFCSPQKVAVVGYEVIG